MSLVFCVRGISFIMVVYGGKNAFWAAGDYFLVFVAIPQVASSKLKANLCGGSKIQLSKSIFVYGWLESIHGKEPWYTLNIKNVLYSDTNIQSFPIVLL